MEVLDVLFLFPLTPTTMSEKVKFKIWFEEMGLGNKSNVLSSVECENKLRLIGGCSVVYSQLNATVAEEL